MDKYNRQNPNDSTTSRLQSSAYQRGLQIENNNIIPIAAELSLDPIGEIMR